MQLTDWGIALIIGIPLLAGAILPGSKFSWLARSIMFVASLALLAFGLNGAFNDQAFVRTVVIVIGVALLIFVIKLVLSAQKKRKEKQKQQNPPGVQIHNHYH